MKHTAISRVCKRYFLTRALRVDIRRICSSSRRIRLTDGAMTAASVNITPGLNSRAGDDGDSCLSEARRRLSAARVAPLAE
jgi:hypothetical protein